MINKELLEWLTDIVAYAYLNRTKEQPWTTKDEQACRQLKQMLEEPTDEERREMAETFDCLVEGRLVGSVTNRRLATRHLEECATKIRLLILSSGKKKVSKEFVEKTRKRVRSSLVNETEMTWSERRLIETMFISIINELVVEEGK